jgi:hypothetical protein
MGSRLVKILSWLLYAAVLFPAIGPLADHHFAERQPGHLHSGTVVVHSHSYGQSHGHADQDSQGSNAIYNFESVQTINFFHTGDELGLTAFWQFRLDSTLVLPSSPTTPMPEPPPRLPHRPPRAIA